MQTSERWAVNLTAMLAAGRQGAAAAAKDVSLTLSATLQTRVLEVGQKDALLVARIDDLRASGESGLAGSTDVDRPMLLRIDRRCVVTELGLHRDTADDAARLQQATALSLSFRLPTAASGQRFEVDERIALGNCHVRYGAARHARDGAVLFKRPLRCAAPEAKVPPVRILAGRSRVVLGQGPWFERLDARLRFAVGKGGMTAQGESTAVVTRAQPKPGALPAAVDRGDYVFGWRDEPANHGGLRQRQKDQRQWPGLTGMSLADVLAEIARLVVDRGAGPGAEWRFVTAWLQANPGGAAELVAAMANGQVPESLRPDMFLALMRAGTPASRDALIQALAHPDLAAADRARAASALAGSDAADRQAFEALRAQLGEARPDDPLDLVGNSAMLGLGIVSARQGEEQPELAAAVRDELRAHLNGELAHDALAAIGNSGDAELWPDALALASDPLPSRRLAAAGALRRMDPRATAAGFATWLAGKEDARILERLVKGYDLSLLTRQATPPPVALKAAIGQLHKAASTPLRQALIRLIGGLAERSPEAKAALVLAFKREWDNSSKQLIGVYVDADALTAAP